MRVQSSYYDRSYHACSSYSAIIVLSKVLAVATVVAVLHETYIVGQGESGCVCVGQSEDFHYLEHITKCSCQYSLID